MGRTGVTGAYDRRPSRDRAEAAPLSASESGGGDRIGRARRESYPPEVASPIERIEYNMQAVATLYNKALEGRSVGDGLYQTVMEVSQLLSAVVKAPEEGGFRDPRPGENLKLLVENEDARIAGLALADLGLLAEAYRVLVEGEERCYEIEHFEPDRQRIVIGIGQQEIEGEIFDLRAAWHCDTEAIRFNIYRRSKAHRQEELLSGRMDMHPFGSKEERRAHINLDGPNLSRARHHLGLEGHFAENMVPLDQDSFIQIEEAAFDRVAGNLEVTRRE